MNVHYFPNAPRIIEHLKFQQRQFFSLYGDLIEYVMPLYPEGATASWYDIKWLYYNTK